MIDSKWLEKNFRHVTWGTELMSLNTPVAKVDASSKIEPDSEFNDAFARQLRYLSPTTCPMSVRLVLLAALCGENLLLIGADNRSHWSVVRRLADIWKDVKYEAMNLDLRDSKQVLMAVNSIYGYATLHSFSRLDAPSSPSQLLHNALCSILTIVTAGESLELPLGFDNEFLFHCTVNSDDDVELSRLIRGNIKLSPLQRPAVALLTHERLQSLRNRAEQVIVPNAVYDLLEQLNTCRNRAVRVTARRWSKVIHVLKTAAAADGRSTVSRWDCLLLPYILPCNITSNETLESWVKKRLFEFDIPDYEETAHAIKDKEVALKTGPGLKRRVDPEGRPLYVNTAGEYVLTPVERIPERDSTGNQLFLSPIRREDATAEKMTLDEVKAFFMTREHSEPNRESWKNPKVRLNCDWKGEEYKAIQRFLDNLVEHRYSTTQIESMMWNLTRSKWDHKCGLWSKDSVVDFLACHGFRPTTKRAEVQLGPTSIDSSDANTSDEYSYAKFLEYVKEPANWFVQEVRLRPALQVAPAQGISEEEIPKYAASLKCLAEDIVRLELEELDLSNFIFSSLWNDGSLPERAEATLDELQGTIGLLRTLHNQLVTLLRTYGKEPNAEGSLPHSTRLMASTMNQSDDASMSSAGQDELSPPPDYGKQTLNTSRCTTPRHSLEQPLVTSADQADSDPALLDSLVDFFGK